MRVPSAPESKVASTDIAIPTADASLPARVYTPKGKGAFPVIVYFHGGGWELADLNVYDATPRGLALGANAVVVSVDYRHAPEHRFPAAHEDAWNAYAWVIENIHTFNGDASRTAVVGESAGGNLAANVAIHARDAKATTPVAQVLVYPVAGDDMTTPPTWRTQSRRRSARRHGMVRRQCLRHPGAGGRSPPRSGRAR